MRRWTWLFALLPAAGVVLLLVGPGCDDGEIEEGCAQACSNSMGCLSPIPEQTETDAMVQCTAHCESSQSACAGATTSAAFQSLLNCIAWMPCSRPASASAVGENCAFELEQVSGCSGNPVQLDDNDASLFGGDSGSGIDFAD